MSGAVLRNEIAEMFKGRIMMTSPTKYDYRLCVKVQVGDIIPAFR